MKEKNQWAILSYNQKDVNLKIISIQGNNLSEEEYNSLLKKKELYEKETIKGESLFNAINVKTKQSKLPSSSNLCSICYQQLTSNKHWCKICGQKVCKSCLVRQRQLKHGQTVMFCTNCDKKYLDAMLNVVHFNEVHLLEKSFIRLVQEQQSLDAMLNLQKKKILNNGVDQTKAMVNKNHQIRKLQEENKKIKQQNEQFRKKIDFGKSIKRDLNKKLYQLRKLQKQSFGSISNQDEAHNEVQPPRAETELDISVQNINESLLTSMLQNQHDLSMRLDQNKCKCDIY